MPHRTRALHLRRPSPSDLACTALDSSLCTPGLAHGQGHSAMASVANFTRQTLLPLLELALPVLHVPHGMQEGPTRKMSSPMHTSAPCTFGALLTCQQSVCPNAPSFYRAQDRWLGANAARNLLLCPRVLRSNLWCRILTTTLWSAIIRGAFVPNQWAEVHDERLAAHAMIPI